MPENIPLKKVTIAGDGSVVGTKIYDVDSGDRIHSVQKLEVISRTICLVTMVCKIESNELPGDVKIVETDKPTPREPTEAELEQFDRIFSEIESVTN